MPTPPDRPKPRDPLVRDHRVVSIGVRGRLHSVAALTTRLTEQGLSFDRIPQGPGQTLVRVVTDDEDSRKNPTFVDDLISGLEDHDIKIEGDETVAPGESATHPMRRR